MVFSPEAKFGIVALTNTNTDASLFSLKIVQTLLPALERAVALHNAAKTSTDSAPVIWKRYEGKYRGLEKWGEDVEISESKGQLVMVRTSGESAMNAPPETINLTRETELRFRINSGSLEGEALVFETDSSGNITRIRIEGCVYRRLR
jgi:hypothetical protein